MLAHELFAFKDSRLLNCHKKFTSFSLIILFILFLSITLFSADVHAVQRQLIFDPSPDKRVIGYNLHYGQSENFDITVDLYNNTTYILPDLDECETYYFAASAYDAHGNESVLSDVLVYTLGDCTEQYFLDVGVNPAGSGTIIKEPDQASYRSDSQVTLAATAASGYEFSHWGGDLSGSENPVTVTMNSNKSVTAHFTAIVETVSAPSVPEGSTSGTVGLNYAYYTSGSSSNLGHPVEYRFDWGGESYSNWSETGNVSHTWSSAGTYSVRAQARSVSDVSVASEWSDSLSVTISPALVPHTVDTIPSALQIVVDGVSYTAPQVFEWEAETSHTLSVTSPQSMIPDERYVFSSWSNGGAQSHTITAQSSATTYTASFAVQYSLATSGGSDGEGTVSPSGVNWYDEDENVLITATAGSCYEFSHWSGDLSGSENPATVAMSASKSVSAHFSYMEPLPKTLVFDPSPDERVAGYKLYYGQNEDVEMIVDLGNNTSYDLVGLEEGATYYFAASAYDAHGNESVLSDVLVYSVGDCTEQYFLDVGVNPAGSGTIIKEPDQASYRSDSQVTLAATAASGYEFSHWGGDLSGSENPVTVTMNSNKSVTAHFTAIVETVSAPSVPEGSTSGTVGLNYAYYASGSSSNLGHPVEYRFDWGGESYSNWSETGNVSHTWSSAGTYSVRAQARSVSDVSVASEWSDSLSVTISPALIPHTVDTIPSGLEIVVDGVSYTAPQVFEWEAGTSHTLSVTSPQSMTPDERYVFSSWSNGGAQSHTITAQSSATTYTASFAVQYSLATSGGSDGEGTVSPLGVNWYDEDENVLITATAGSCYEFSHWSGDLSGSENPATVAMSASKSVSAHFSYMEPLPKTLVFDSSPDERVAGYKLYYGQNEDVEMIVDLGNNTSYDLVGLEEGATYYFAATAYDEQGNESDFSEILTYTVPETYADCGIVESEPTDQHIMEMGEVFINHQWQRVDFNGIFIDPIVVAKPGSLNDPEPGVVRIRNVDEFGFEIRIQEWDYLDGFHDYENVSYLAVEKGSYVLPGGIMMEAGKFEADGTHFLSNPFAHTFNYSPVVIASLTSTNEENAVVGRMRNVSRNGFEYRLQQQETSQWNHGRETVSFVAFEPFSGVLNGVTIEVGTTGNEVDHNFYYLSYSETFLNEPYFLADMQTTNGGDTANVRYRNKDRYGAEIKIAEEQSKDIEMRHVKENVGYFIISK